MYHTSVMKAKNDLGDLINMVVDDSEVINISTDKGNAVIINENVYNSLVETLYFTSNAELKQTIMDGLHTSLEDCIDEEKVEW